MMSPPRGREREFAQFLQGFVDREDRAPLAALRRGIGKTPGEAAEMHRYVVPFLPRESRWGEEDAHYLIAALFALHQRSWPTGDDPRAATNLGASFAQLARVTDESGQGQPTESMERRFVALLNCHADDLPDHLRHVVSLLRTHEVPVDWAQLLRDVQEWEWESRSVQRAWARAFWQRRSEQEPEGILSDNAPDDDEQPTE